MCWYNRKSQISCTQSSTILSMQFTVRYLTGTGSGGSCSSCWYVCSFSSGWIDIRSVYRMDSLFPYSCIALQFFCLAMCDFSRSGCQAVCATRLSACIDYLVRMPLVPRTPNTMYIYMHLTYTTWHPATTVTHVYTHISHTLTTYTRTHTHTHIHTHTYTHTYTHTHTHAHTHTHIHTPHAHITHGTRTVTIYQYVTILQYDVVQYNSIHLITSTYQYIT